MIQASAPAKVILFGEHAVVHGRPAIAAPVGALRAYVTAQPNPPDVHGLRIAAADVEQTLPVDIHAETVENALALTARLVLQHLGEPAPELTLLIRSDIPIASGLGSGAAVSTALARALASALGKPIPLDVLNALVYEVEKIHHGTPSGIDNTVVVYERLVYFMRAQPIETFTLPCAIHLLIGDTGVSASTRTAIDAVRALLQSAPDRYEPMLDEIASIVRNARVALETGDIPTLGRLMTQDHAILRDLTVSSPELEQLVNAAVSAGALGAKLSGGGRGGNMIALVTPQTRFSVEAALIAAGARRVYATTLGEQALC